MYVFIGLIWIAVFIYFCCTYEDKPVNPANTIGNKPTKTTEVVDDFILYGEVNNDNDFIIN